LRDTYYIAIANFIAFYLFLPAIVGEGVILSYLCADNSRKRHRQQAKAASVPAHAHGKKVGKGAVLSSRKRASTT